MDDTFEYKGFQAQFSGWFDTPTRWSIGYWIVDDPSDRSAPQHSCPVMTLKGNPALQNVFKEAGAATIRQQIDGDGK